MSKGYITIIVFCILGYIESVGKEREYFIKDMNIVLREYMRLNHAIISQYNSYEQVLMKKDFYRYPQIRRKIYGLIQDNKNNIDPETIRAYVRYHGSERYINEYKALFLSLYDKRYSFTLPKECYYKVDKQGRITYFEARGYYRKSSKRIYDR